MLQRVPESLVHAPGVMGLSRSLYSSLGPSADSRSGPAKNVYSISKDSIVLGFEDCSKNKDAISYQNFLLVFLFLTLSCGLCSRWCKQRARLELHSHN